MMLDQIARKQGMMDRLQMKITLLVFKQRYLNKPTIYLMLLA